MVGRRYGLISKSSYIIAINTISNIEQGIVVDLFIPTSTSFTITPTIYSLGGRVAGMGPISNYPTTTTNIISWKIQQYNMFT